MPSVAGGFKPEDTTLTALSSTARNAFNLDLTAFLKAHAELT